MQIHNIHYSFFDEIPYRAGVKSCICPEAVLLPNITDESNLFWATVVGGRQYE
jgi:hypothetical protein